MQGHRGVNANRRMKVIKTDGSLMAGPEHLAHFDGLDVEFIDQPFVTEDALIAHCSDADALMVLKEPITARVIASLRHCKLISRFGVGLDVVDVEAATRAGIRVTNVPDGNVEEVSTHAMAMILMLARKLRPYDAAVRAGRWKVLPVGEGVRRENAQTLGIVGFGRIGSRVAKKAKAFGYRMVACDPCLKPELLRAEGVEPMGFDELVACADVVSLHVPRTPETLNMMSAAAIARMKPGAVLINVSRGGLLDEAALALALTSGHLSGAGLDTLAQEPPAPDNPLLALDNVILSPHAAHYSAQSYSEVLHKSFANVAAVLKGQTPAYPVNFL
ncbi:MAG: C-terminal binding protein [Rhizobacter sp.]|nr:C-terminal binding protein [Rhizobacter sp.]